MKDYSDIVNNRYKVTPVSSFCSQKMNSIMAVVKMLDNEIQSKCPEGQYKDIASIKLQECSMWINKSLSHGEI